MRKNIHKIFVLLAISFLICSCVREQFERVEMERPETTIHFDNQIQPSTLAKQENEKDLPPHATKALVSAQTTRHLKTNFLRIDEEISTDNLGTYVYPSWENGYLLEASVISSPGNLENAYMRSVFLQPVQTYKITVTPKEGGNLDDNDTTFYHTRMISWHPMTCRLRKIPNPDPQRQDSIASVQKFNHFVKKNVGYDAYSVSGNTISINFRDLDGTKDIMVSEIREGQHWHSKYDKTGPQESWQIDHPESDDIDGKLYRQPFGRNEINPQYDNCFKYQHFMSAVRVHAYSDKEVQNASMWGEIQKVIVKNQPKEASVSIPTFNPDKPNERTYGTFIPGSTQTFFPLQKGPVYGDDTNTDQQQTANDHITLEGTSVDKPAYLGYAMIAPNQDLVLDIHTDSGIYSVTIDAVQKDQSQIFQSGYIYDITLNFGTHGTIAAMLLKDAGGNYFDLTTGEKYTSSGNQSNFIYKTANCYMVNPTLKNENGEYYDGYTFLATEMGNGEGGLKPEFSMGTAKLDQPVYAGLIWESKLGLVTQVEFMYDYIRFKIQKPVNDNQFDEGNAVIGVYNKDQKLLWSWHIWITDQVQDIELGQNTMVQDRNLGATAANPNKEEPLQTYGLYYQWGRKDPSMGAPRNNYTPLSSECAHYYDYYGNELNGTSVIFKDNPTIQDGIENPMYLIFPSQLPSFYPFNWLNDRINNLWGSGNEDKTIFDPCPFGYMVPSKEIENYVKNHEGDASFSNTNAMSFENGKVWFPYAGFKGVDRGISSLTASWKYVGMKGDYMSRNIYPSNDHRCRTYLSSSNDWTETGADHDGDGYGDANHQYQSNFIYDYANRRTAASIRCIKQGFTMDGTISPVFDSFPNYLFLGKDNRFTYTVQAEFSKIYGIRITDSANPTTPLVQLTYPDPAIKDQRSYSSEGIISYPINAYDQIGEHTYTLHAGNDKGITSTITKVANVLSLINLQDIKIGGTPVKNNAIPLNQGAQNFSFSLLTRNGEPANKQDMILINKYLKFYVNGVETSYEGGTYTTNKKITLPEDKITIECRDGNTVLRRFEMNAEYKTGNQITNIKNLEDGYYAFNDIDQPTWWWYHNGGDNVLARYEPTGGYLHKNNIFKLATTNNGRNNWKEYNIELYSNGDYLNNDLTGSYRSRNFGFFDNGNSKFGFYRARGDKAIKKNNGDNHTLTVSNQSWDQGDEWYIYPVDVNKIYYRDPVEITP